jgi:hypothetical protein
MAYKLLGIVLWKGGKVLLRRRYSAWLPKPVFAGGFVLVLAGIALAAARARGNGS